MNVLFIVMGWLIVLHRAKVLPQRVMHLLWDMWMEVVIGLSFMIFVIAGGHGRTVEITVKRAYVIPGQIWRYEVVGGGWWLFCAWDARGEFEWGQENRGCESGGYGHII